MLRLLNGWSNTKGSGRIDGMKSIQALMWGVVVIGLLFLSACGKSDETLAEKGGKEIGEGLGNLVTGMAAGIDETMTVSFVLSEEMTKKGLNGTVAKTVLGVNDGKALAFYLTSENKLSLTLMAKALNKDGLEIGRAKTNVDFDLEDGKYVEFTFDDHMDRAHVQVYKLSIAAALPEPVDSATTTDAPGTENH
jgi:hypothetical protein